MIVVDFALGMLTTALVSWGLGRTRAAPKPFVPNNVYPLGWAIEHEPNAYGWTTRVYRNTEPERTLVLCQNVWERKP